jgi:hypothetical protein
MWRRRCPTGGEIEMQREEWERKAKSRCRTGMRFVRSMDR